MIDWQKPVETCEDPPRPVRVLFDKDGKAIFGTLNDSGPWHIQGGRILDNDLLWVRLRNIPEHKPEPVRHEAWLNLYGNGAFTKHHDKDDAELCGVSSGRVECRRITWMSDGSTAPASPEQLDQMRETAKLIIDRDQWQTKAGEALLLLHEANDRCDNLMEALDQFMNECDGLRGDVERLNKAVRRFGQDANEEKKRAEVADDEIARMKPVYDAAMAFEAMEWGSLPNVIERLISAVRAAQQGQPSADPEKSCANCRNFKDNVACVPGYGMTCIHSLHAVPGATDKWEPRR